MRRGNGGRDDTAKGPPEEHTKLIPWRYRNVINPWQTPREIRNAVRWFDRVLKKTNDEERQRITRELDPDRDWRTNG